jgi:ADP-heptose:LPS heptosyltransferase
MRRNHSERGSRLKRILDLLFGSILVAALGSLRRPRKQPTEVSSIGLFMFGAIGDTLLASAIVPDLKRAFPFARIVAFISKANRGVLDLLDAYDEVVVIPVTRPLAAVPLIRQHRVDVLIDIGQWAKVSALLARLARSRFTVGFKTRGQFRHFAFDAVIEHSPAVHELDNFRALLGGIGISGRSLPRFKPSLLAEIQVPAARAYVVFHPWASGFRSELREWAQSRWVQLGKLVLDWGFDIVVTGGPEDAPRADALVAALGGTDHAISLAGRASLRETTREVGRAAAVVSVNTGIMHLAALLDRPMVALHGPTNARRWGPIGTSAIVVGPGPEAGGGFLNLGFEYPRTPPDCMGQISVASVAQPLHAMLGPASYSLSTRRGEPLVQSSHA